MAKLYAMSSAGFVGSIRTKDDLKPKNVYASNNDQNVIDGDMKPGESFWVRAAVSFYGEHEFKMPEDGHDMLVEFYGTVFNPEFDVRRR